MASPYSDTALQAAEAELRDIFLELEGESAAFLDTWGRNDQGDVKGSIYSDVQPNTQGLLAVVGSNSDHAAVVHEGRGAGKRRPPTEPIRRWAMRKLGVPESESRGVAFVIARKIGRVGIKGTPFLRDPFRAKYPEMAPRIQRRVALALDNRVSG